jgi:hypothetical protein
MPHAISIVPTTQTLDLRDGHGEIAFTVSNTTGKAFRVSLRALAGDAAAEGWISIKGPPDRLLSAEATEQVTVAVAIPKNTKQSTFDVRLRVASELDPDETWAESQGVRVQIPEPGDKPKTFPWWIAAAVVAVLAITGGVIAFLMTRKAGLHDSCTEDQNCKPGLACAPSSGAERSCLAEVNVVCSANADCTTGTCDGGKCVLAGLGMSCTSACAAGLTCSAGTCKAPKAFVGCQTNDHCLTAFCETTRQTCMPEVLKLMPTTCSSGFGYVDFAGLFGSDSIAKLSNFHPAWLTKDLGERSFTAMQTRWKTLKDAGTDPLALLDDAAGCVDAAADGWVVAVRFKAPKAIELLSLFSLLNQDMKDLSIEVAAPNVLLFGERPQFLSAAKQGGGASAFSLALTNHVFLNYQEGSVSAEGTIHEKSGTIQGQGSVTDRRGTDLDRQIRSLRSDIAQIADELPVPPLSVLAERVRSVQITQENGAIVGKASISRSDLLALSTAVAEADPEIFVPAPPVTYFLDSLPQGANVSVNRKAAGVTPAQLSLPVGESEIELSMRGHATTTIRETVARGARDFARVVVMNPNVHLVRSAPPSEMKAVKIVLRPADASLTINGTVHAPPQNKTVQLDTSGEHQFLIEAPGYRSLRMSVAPGELKKDYNFVLQRETER